MVKPIDYHETTGGSLVGYLPPTTYAELVAALGEPNSPNDGYKTQAEWAVALDDGTKLSIYDYKQGESYRQDGSGVPAEDVTEWHVGGDARYGSPTALALIDELVYELNAARQNQ